MALVVKATSAPDDYAVLHGELVIGQIFKRKVALVPENQWLWALNGVPQVPADLEITGVAPTLEVATAALEARWEKWLQEAKLTEVNDNRTQER